MCVPVKENALNEERVRGRDVDIRADRPADRLYCGIRTVRDKNLKTQETHLW